MVTERRDGNVNLVLTDGQSPPTWQMRIHAVSSTLASPTPAGQVADRLARLERAKSKYKVLSNAPVTYRGATGQLCYLEQVAPDGNEYIMSWLVMLTDPGRFLVFSTFTLPENILLFAYISYIDMYQGY